MMKIEKYYNVFNLLLASKEDATSTLKGWEHKETITERYIVIESNEIMPEINLDTNPFLLFSSIEDAQEELNEYL